MRKFKVYQRHWGHATKVTMHDYETGGMKSMLAYRVDLRPVMSIDAYSPEHALRIAKQKGVVLPIIGEANDPMAP